MIIFLQFFSVFILLIILGYVGVPLWVWSLYGVAVLAVGSATVWLWVMFGVVAVVMNVPLFRRSLVTSLVVKCIKKFQILPRISDTERAAIEAGNVWVDGEFFSGKPDFARMQNEPYPLVMRELQEFLDGPVEKVCQMASDWEIYRRQDLPPQVWEYLKQERFFGMMIPPEYGGLGFSNFAYSTVMTKLASRSFTHVATVSVPNSLGPAKLLLRYGTAAQKDYYLPRLARGEEIPCFALTEPNAGSDAASIQSSGVVFQEDGKLYLRLNWHKRYITLGAIATLLGLAFQLQDPENLLGKGENVGITCALIPTDTPGVVLARRHDPMGVPFYNSPTQGHDVIVPIEQIIGGVEQAGEGWKMLMQSLAGGRGISFPATCTGVAKLVSRVTGAYSIVRRQFGLPIGKFEGVEEPLARIGGLTYLMDAARIYTCGAVDKGEQPAVISAIAKYNLTELSRQIINDGMDIMGGAGICRGERNLLANIYTATPISITVEGANILTRTMMIFGQGAIRCHPYVYKEIEALERGDIPAFDSALWHHIGLTIRNGFRTELLSISRGYLARPFGGVTAPYYRKLEWASASFALMTDLALFSFGGALKRRENLTGRFADILSWMYLVTATLRRFEEEGCKQEDLLFVHWAMQYSFAQIQSGFEGICENWSVPVIGRLLQIVGWWWRMNPIGTLPADELGSKVARSLQTPGEQRDRLTKGIYIPTSEEEALGRMEKAFLLSSQAEPIIKAIKNGIRAGKLPQKKPEQLITEALVGGLISREEAELVYEAQMVRNDAIQVDSFTLEEYQRESRVAIKTT